MKNAKEAKDVKEDDMDGWEAAPVKGKGNKKGKNGKGKGIQRQEKVEQKTPAKKTVESVKNVNSEPVKVEPVEPKAKVTPVEKEKETPPEPKVFFVRIPTFCIMQIIYLNRPITILWYTNSITT